MLNDLERLLMEVVRGRTVDPSDTPEKAAQRARLAQEVAEITARGGIVDIPFEFPDLSEDDDDEVPRS